MPPKRAASGASKAASAATSKPPATRAARKTAAPATGAAAPAPRVTRSRAAAASTAPEPPVDNPEPRKRRKAAANENTPTDQTEAPVPAEKGTTKPFPKRRRRVEQPHGSDDPRDVKESDQAVDRAAADQHVPGDRTDPVAPASNDTALPPQRQNDVSGSVDLPALLGSGQTDIEAVAGNNDRTDVARSDDDDGPSRTQPTPQPTNPADLPAGQDNDQANAQAVTTASDLQEGRRLDTLWPELIAAIFEQLPSLRDLAAVAPLRKEFHQISNAILYRRLVGLFDAPAALRLCVTMVKRRGFSMNTLVFDGQHIAAQLPRQHLNAITGALQTTCNLEALTLPSITDRVLSDCVHRRLQVLRVLGPDPPLSYIARHPWLKALEFHPASINQLSDPARIGPGVPLAFVRCCMAVAAQLMPPRPPPPPVDEDGKPVPDDDSKPSPPRTLASDAILEVHPSTTVMAQAKYDARQFLKALAETHRAPGTLVLDRLALEDVAEVISKDKEPPVVLTVSRIRLCMKVSNMTAVMQNLEFIAAILMCFKGLTTLELRDEVTPVPAQVDENVWLDDNQLSHWKKTRPTLTRIVSPQKRAYAYKYPIWTQVEDAVDQPSPFQPYGL